MGSWMDVTASEGGTFKAYVATPAAGSGPGLLLLQEIFGVNQHIREVADLWAEEGYTVVAPDLFWRLQPGIELGYDEASFGQAFGYYQRFDMGLAIADMQATVQAMRGHAAVQGGIGALGFCLGGKLAYLAAAECGVDAAVGYYGVGIEADLARAAKITCPVTFHFAGLDKFVPPEAVTAVQGAFAGRHSAKIYVYPGVDHGFNAPRHAYHRPSAALAHSRSLECLRPVIGPHYDLSALWDKHCELEFGTRDAAATMKTMVAEPYVNHVPTLTGGIGYKDLYRFYKHHFIPQTPQDTALQPLSRTVGIDRLVDEMIFSFTHDIEIDWLLPGIKPTGRKVAVPLIAVVHFRGDKLYNEHIHWDQASVLVQIGLLDPKGLPVAGVETANKLLDPAAVPSNGLMARWATSAGQA